MCFTFQQFSITTKEIFRHTKFSPMKKIVQHYLHIIAAAIIFNTSSLYSQVQSLQNNDSLIARQFLDSAQKQILSGELEEAWLSCDSALALYQTSIQQDELGRSDVYHLQALIRNNQSRLDEALSLYQQSLAIRQRKHSKPHPSIAISLNNIGINYAKQGKYPDALTYMLRGLNINRAILGEKDVRVGQAYANIGKLYDLMGENDEALICHQKALSILTEKLGENDPTLAYAYNNVAVSYYRRKDNEQALVYFAKSLKLKELKTPQNPLDLAAAYNNLGMVHNDLGNTLQAIEYYEKALAIFRSKFGEEHLDVAAVYFNIGNLYDDLGEYSKAEEYQKTGLKIRTALLPEKHAYLCESLRALGNLERHRGNQVVAVEYYDMALDKLGYNPSHGIGSASSVITLIDLFFQKGKAYRSLHAMNHSLSSLQFADTAYQSAIAATDFFRSSANFMDEKLWLANDLIPVYESAIFNSLNLLEVTSDTKYANQTFVNAEQSKSFALLNAYKNTQALHLSGISNGLIQEEALLTAHINQLSQDRLLYLQSGGEETEEKILTLSAEIFDAQKKYKELISKFEREYPRYYNLRYSTEIISLKNLQDNLLKPNSTLLEYYVGDSSLFLLIVSRDNYQVKEIPKDFPLESWVRQLQHGLSAYHTLSPNDPLRENFAFRDSCTRAYITAAQNLYDKLVKPVKNLLREEIIIVPDGVLGYVPFEVLLTGLAPADINRYHKYPYLLRDHHIRYTYSATLLKEMTDKKHRREPEKRFAAFAPYYDGDTSVLAGLDALFTGRTVTPDALAPLKYSGPEVLAAQNLMGGDVFLDSTATEERFNQVAGNYRILHLSTHGKADDRVGDYAYLMFSPQKDSVENELLYCRDIYNLTLNADLVVLSACETGIGKLSRGEGIISLARAFAYAGAKSIVNSLWSVNDISTQDLMIRFYENLKAGKSKSESLALAKRKFLDVPSDKEQERYQKLGLQWEQFRPPYFWGGFILIGDDAEVR